MLKIALALLAACLAFTQASAADDNMPFGFELGVATFDQVKQFMDGKTTMQQGFNRYSGGRMLVAQGDGLGIEDLAAVALVFDKEQRLVASILTLARGNAGFGGLLDRFTGTHALKERHSNGAAQYALFEKGDGLVELSSDGEAELTLGFITRDFMDQSKRIQDLEKRARDGLFAEQG